MAVDASVGAGVPVGASVCVGAGRATEGDASVVAVVGSGRLVAFGSVVAVGGTEVTTTGVWVDGTEVTTMGVWVDGPVGSAVTPTTRAGRGLHAASDIKATRAAQAQTVALERLS
jgi:hypothetical protein